MKRQWERYLLQEAKIVFKYLIKIGVAKEDAEDIVQEAIIKTIGCLSQIEANKLRAWLFKVALNRYYTIYNKKKIQSYLTDEDIQQLQASVNIEEQLISREQNEQLRLALLQLPQQFQQLLIMKYFMDLSYKEIASIIDHSENHVRTYLQRARKALRKKWEEA
ncbi:RNA polymerase subunit sigma-24 [Lysinibacillus sp. B2A1]|nr:RNA polymerase subunit sigma-24 [Lysinibacillus sp. B2A1]